MEKIEKNKNKTPQLRQRREFHQTFHFQQSWTFAHTKTAF